MHRFPDGIAHFLEHKLFEQKEVPSVMEKFSELGDYSNAFTNYLNTAYYFSGTENFLESLNFLLDYVQEPYFTDENVEKEKGIIEQEIKMYKDQPFREGYDRVILNSFVISLLLDLFLNFTKKVLSIKFS